jgi:putative pyruvate formate lyase activating enzyme
MIRAVSANRLTSVPGQCFLCPRKCGVDRWAGGDGYCRAGTKVQIFRHGLHHGEEPPVSGTRGSGTVFFSRCTLRCIFCQNHPWSQSGEGREYEVSGLADVFVSLAEAGAHNWNWVSPTPWLPWIVEALDMAVARGVELPVVYNTSGFENVDVLRMLDGRVAVYLTDLRYSRPETAEAGSGSAGYVEASRAALEEMWRQVGPLEMDGEGIAQRGTICRLLVLPGFEDEAVANLEWMAATVGTEISVSVMSQYTPTFRAVGVEPWGRRPTAGEYERVVEAVDRLGFAQGWVQDYDTPAADELVGFNMNPV